MAMHIKLIFVGTGALIAGLLMGAHIGVKETSVPSTHTSMHGAMADMMAALDGKTGDVFDKAFLSEMIVHHEGAVEMAEAALRSAKHDEIKELATAIITAQTTEIAQMRSWQEAWYGEGDETPDALIGSSWIWRKSVVGGDAVVEPTKAGAFTLTFGVDGRVSGTTDCNSFSGLYTRSGDTLTIGPLASTKIFCPESEETVFTSALTEGPLTVEFPDAHTLVLQFSEATSMFFERSH
jgi:heat shock protein HslJ